jgi:hypothetical protein
VGFEKGAFDLDVKIAKTHVQQMLIGKTMPRNTIAHAARTLATV